MQCAEKSSANPRLWSLRSEGKDQVSRRRRLRAKKRQPEPSRSPGPPKEKKKERGKKKKGKGKKKTGHSGPGWLPAPPLETLTSRKQRKKKRKRRVKVLRASFALGEKKPPCRTNFNARTPEREKKKKKRATSPGHDVLLAMICPEQKTAKSRKRKGGGVAVAGAAWSRKKPPWRNRPLWPERQDQEGEKKKERKNGHDPFTTT